jgi:redox-sensing transcriptional repressor
MEEYLNINSHTIRKDINYIGEIGPSPSGYPVKELNKLLSVKLGLEEKKKTCIVGIGKLGMAIINYLKSNDNDFMLIAGFESNTNKIEITDAGIPLYPTYRIKEIVEEKGIELAIITVSNTDVDEIIFKLESGGIRGIINFTAKTIKPIIKKSGSNIWIRNINFENELRKLSAVIELNKYEE